MTIEGRNAAAEKLRAAGAHPAAVRVFTHYYEQLEAGATGLVLEDTIDPLTTPDRYDDLDRKQGIAALGKTVIMKLNGGLGTSMGLDAAKTLLPVRDGRSFLDLIASQVLWARQQYGVRLPVVFMDSFRTSSDTLAALRDYPTLPVDGLPLDFLQNFEPKLRADDLMPVEWPKDPSLEWCPPGHGDLYTAILTTGMLDALLNAGYRYGSVANADNLGSFPSPELAGWFASTGAPYAAEVCIRTPMDRKGGHLARRKSDGRLILRDTAQTAPEELAYFTDEHRHPFFHTNNLWFDLAALREALSARDGILGLPLIRNAKTVDPADLTSTPVVQIETAMGAAIEVFDGARAVEVPRSRFLPVKTTNELMLIRSDAYVLGENGVPTLALDVAPVISLDPAHYRTVADLDAHVPDGIPSLRRATSLTIQGDWTFGRGVVVIGDVTLPDLGRPVRIPDNFVLDAAGAASLAAS